MVSINDKMKGEVCCFKSPVLASIIMYKNKASTMFKLLNSEDDDEVDLKKVADKIKK